VPTADPAPGRPDADDGGPRWIVLRVPASSRITVDLPPADPATAPGGGHPDAPVHLAVSAGSDGPPAVRRAPFPLAGAGR
jgi:hypothetical protein